jgi:hypothetical protein
MKDAVVWRMRVVLPRHITGQLLFDIWPFPCPLGTVDRYANRSVCQILHKPVSPEIFTTSTPLKIWNFSPVIEFSR